MFLDTLRPSRAEDKAPLESDLSAAPAFHISAVASASVSSGRQAWTPALIKSRTCTVPPHGVSHMCPSGNSCTTEGILRRGSSNWIIRLYARGTKKLLHFRIRHLAEIPVPTANRHKGIWGQKAYDVIRF